MYLKKPCISIIIPVYQVEEYLKTCIDSVLKQTFQDFEVILVDDGSPDQCGRICDEYAAKDQRIITIHKPNGGLSDARNAALDVVTGEYLTFVDSDDYIAENHLASLYYAIILYQADIAVSNITTVTTDKKLNEKFYRPEKEIKVLSGLEVFNTLNRPNACGKLYKKSIFKNIRFPVGRLYEDVFIYHDVLGSINRLVLTGENTYYYLIRNNSIMHQDYRLEFTDIIDAIEARIKKLESVGLQELADQNREFIYSRVSVAYANLDDSIDANNKRLKEIKCIYDKEYPKLIHTTKHIKQKFRYWLLYRLPDFHSVIFGKKMAKTLG